MLSFHVVYREVDSYLSFHRNRDQVSADGPSTYTITGGLFQDFAPSVYHLQYVLFPSLKRMGITIDLEIIQPGYVPQGNGQIKVKIIPVKSKLKPLSLIDQGKIIGIRGISLSSLLKARKVSERMAKECQKKLNANDRDLKWTRLISLKNH